MVKVLLGKLIGPTVSEKNSPSREIFSETQGNRQITRQGDALSCDLCVSNPISNGVSRLKPISDKIKAIEVKGYTHDGIVEDMQNHWFSFNKISEEALDFLISLGDQNGVTAYPRIKKSKEAKEYHLDEIDWVIFWDNGTLKIKANKEIKELSKFKTSKKIREEEILYFNQPHYMDEDKFQRLKKLVRFANTLIFEDLRTSERRPLDEIKVPFIYQSWEYDELFDRVKINGFLVD